MKLRSASALLVSLAAIAIANDAKAQPTPWETRRRVLVLSSDWEVATRLRRLLAGVSLDARIDAEEAPCDPARVQRNGVAAFASSVLCTDKTGIEVWTTEGHSFEKRERIAWATTPPTIRDEAIVQATEIVRADVASMPPLPPEPVAAPAPSPTPAVAPPPQVVDMDRASAAPASASAQNDGRRTASFIFGAGPAWLTSNGYSPTWGAALDAELGVSKSVAVAANAVFPLSTATLGPGGESGARTMAFGLGVEIPLLPPDAFVVPRVGGGAGVLWMHTEPLYEYSDAVNHNQDFVLPQFYVDGAASMQVYGRLRLVLAGTLAATTTQIVVRVNDQEQGRFGWPIAMTQLRFEAQL